MYWWIADDLNGEGQVPPMKKLEDLIHLAELCVDLLQQNEEHYAEVGPPLVFDVFSWHFPFNFYSFNIQHIVFERNSHNNFIPDVIFNRVQVQLTKSFELVFKIIEYSIVFK